MRVAAPFPRLVLHHAASGKRQVALCAAEVNAVKKVKRINKVVLFLQLASQYKVTHFHLTSLYVNRRHAENPVQDVKADDAFDQA